MTDPNSAPRNLESAGENPSLVEWLRECLDQDELLAKEAGRVRGELTGAHWHWEDNGSDEPLSVDFGLEYLNFDDSSSWARSVSLRSVEEVPTTSVGPLPEFIIHGEDEMKSVHAAHIVAWDPARVLAEIAAKRELLDLHRATARSNSRGRRECITCFETETPCRTLLILAQPYRSRPGFRKEWWR
ncbi:DUF6221 family protein [Kineosporia babensis]|uniref:DUF6221 family protein n=1 Tax=Kineosporia babensis TaxID=499548 RepID=A0A9X1NBS5_9ACTN|nr:DUF6221 family protein [Kineosporia babensis]MCD5310819.1 DUF6221 family protein [Kineosporia babensis]